MRLKWLRRRLANWAIKVICHDEDHAWKEYGSGTCPYSECECLQPFFECVRCGVRDCGKIGGPGWKLCKGCDLRPEK